MSPKRYLYSIQKLSLLLCAIYLPSLKTNGQRIDQSGFTASVGTYFPVQHGMQLGWIFTKKQVLETYVQIGIQPRAYIRPLVEVSVSQDKQARDYLKANLQGRIGYGAGFKWHYRRFDFDIAYNRLTYRIHRKSSKELVNNLAYDDPGLKVALGLLSDWVPAFDELYSDYLITPVANAHQVSLSGGYRFPLYKSVWMGMGAGVSTTMQTSVHIQSDRSRQSAEILLDAVTPNLTKKLESLINWHMIPTVNLQLIYRFPRPPRT